MNRIIIACDSFKGSMSASEVCDIITDGLRAKHPDVQIISIPVADGGEGTVDSYLYALGGERVNAGVMSPLMNHVDAYFGIVNGDTAVIECAAASGITVEKKNNALHASSYGTGQFMKTALDMGIRKFIVGLGGSATTDAGTGLLCALGMKFLDTDGCEVPTGGVGLSMIEKIVADNFDNRIAESNITVLCDVTNPLYGEKGAAYVYSPQKGASPDDVVILDDGLRNFSARAADFLGTDYSAVPGAGAAGGLGFALYGFCSGKLKRGIDAILDITGFDEKSADADLVITGEGKMDSQSLCGKVPFGVAARSRAEKCIAIVGILDDDADIKIIKENGIQEVYETNENHLPFEVILPFCKADLYKTVMKIFI